MIFIEPEENQMQKQYMSGVNSPSLNIFFGSRALSTFGDEIWEIAIPIYLSIAGFASKQAGLYYSFYAAGTVLGFLVLPRLAQYCSAKWITITVDIFQIAVFLVLGTWILYAPIAPLWLFCSCGFFLAAASAVWFGSSETLAAKIMDRSSSLAFHRLNYLSSTVGPFVAPLVGTTLFSFTGLPLLALFNALTFMPQILAVNGLEEKANKTDNFITDRKVPSAAKVSIRMLLRHPLYGPLLGLTSTVKVGLLGVLPFIGFILVKTISSPFWLGVVLAAFPFGSFLGALTYRSFSHDRLSSVFFMDTVLMFLASAALIISLKVGLFWGIPAGALFGGVFCARYTIQIRAMRQIVSHHDQMPALVSLQGLFSRIVTPVSGVMFGILFALDTSQLFVYVIGLCIVIVGSIFSFISARAFKDLISEKIE